MKFSKSENNNIKNSINKTVCLFMISFWVTLVEAKQHKIEMMIDEATIKVAPKLDYKGSSKKQGLKIFMAINKPQVENIYIFN